MTTHAVVDQRRRVFCGRPGCHAPIAAIAPAGTVGDRVAWAVVLGRRWLHRVDLDPARWRRGPHNRSTARRHESEDPGPHGGPAELLPVTVECPRCGAVQRIDPPASGVG